MASRLPRRFRLYWRNGAILGTYLVLQSISSSYLHWPIFVPGVAALASIPLWYLPAIIKRHRPSSQDPSGDEELMHPVLATLIGHLEELAPATAPETSHDRDDELIRLGPAAEGAIQLGLRTSRDWAFLSFDGFDGGLEFILSDRRDQADLEKICTAVATGTATIALRTRRSMKRFARVNIPDGPALSASAGFGDIFTRREYVQCRPWTVD